jgi:endonuclease-8
VPEGDVVLRTARRLHAALAGKELTRSDLRWPSLATADLTGRKVLEVAATGKHLLIRTEGGLTLHSHLRMDGSWHLHRTGRRWAGARPEHEIRAVLANADWTAIGHRLGMLDLVATGEESRLVGHLGPDILAADWDLDGAVSRVAAHPDRSIGETLLDQRVIAGIGTFFMSEACFLRGVNPWLRVAAVTDLAALVAMAAAAVGARPVRPVVPTLPDPDPGGRAGRRPDPAGGVLVPGLPAGRGPHGPRPAPATARRRAPGQLRERLDKLDKAVPPSLSGDGGTGSDETGSGGPGELRRQTVRHGVRNVNGAGHEVLSGGDPLAHLEQDRGQRHGQRAADRGQQFGGRFLLPALYLAQVTEGDPGHRGHLAQGAALLAPGIAEHVADLLPQ